MGKSDKGGQNFVVRRYELQHTHSLDEPKRKRSIPTAKAKRRRHADSNGDSVSYTIELTESGSDELVQVPSSGEMGQHMDSNSEEAGPHKIEVMPIFYEDLDYSTDEMINLPQEFFWPHDNVEVVVQIVKAWCGQVGDPTTSTRSSGQDHRRLTCRYARYQPGQGRFRLLVFF